LRVAAVPIQMLTMPTFAWRRAHAGTPQSRPTGRPWLRGCDDQFFYAARDRTRRVRVNADGLWGGERGLLPCATAAQLVNSVELFTVWCECRFGTRAISIMPHSWQLRHFPVDLEQLQMGSNGRYTGLHRGTTLVPHASIRFCRPLRPVLDRHNMQVATVFAHAEASALAKTNGELTEEGRPTLHAPFLVTKGSCPSNMILADALPPLQSRCSRGSVPAEHVHAGRDSEELAFLTSMAASSARYFRLESSGTSERRRSSAPT
jgi:Phosphoglucose isomerase